MVQNKKRQTDTYDIESNIIYVREMYMPNVCLLCNKPVWQNDLCHLNKRNDKIVHLMCQASYEQYTLVSIRQTPNKKLIINYNLPF